MKITWAAMVVMFLGSVTSYAAQADQTVVFDVQKMTCATCPIAVRTAIRRVNGVKVVRVSFENKSAIVTFDPSTTSTAVIAKASTDVGFPATARVSE